MDSCALNVLTQCLDKVRAQRLILKEILVKYDTDPGSLDLLFVPYSLNSVYFFICGQN